MDIVTEGKGKKMAKYIDRETLMADIEESVVFSGRQSRNAEILGANKIIDRIKVAPMVDVVPVVRCRDCKQFMEYTKEYKRCVEGADGDCRIRLFHSCEKQFIACKYNDFCSYGERK